MIYILVTIHPKLKKELIMTKAKQKAIYIEDEIVETEENDRISEEEEIEVTESNYLENDDKGYHDSIKSYLRDISQYNLLNFDEEKDLSKRIQDGDEEALNQLINSNLRLVVKIAKAFVSKEYPFIDIIQDGNMGLIRAAQKYDYKRNVRFSTYAARWIKQMIIRALSQKKRLVRLPYRKEKTLKQIKELTSRYLSEEKRYPTSEEISKELGIKQKEIDATKLSDISVLSLEENLNDEDNHFALENIVGDEAYNPDDTLIKKDMERETKAVLETLYEREKQVIIRRFGLETNEKSTFKEMGEHFGLSAETVRQMELKALKKIETHHSHLKTYIYK